MKQFSDCKINKTQPILSFLNSINPKTDWKQQVSQGKIKVHGLFVGINYNLKIGDVVCHDPYLKIQEPKINKNYHFLFEDEDLVIIDKPAPLPVHPTGKYLKNSLTQILKTIGKNWYSINRIDSETSGIILFAKSPEKVKFVTLALKEATKIYLVMVYGIPNKKFKVEMNIGKKIGSKIFRKQGENKKLGKPTLSNFYRIKTWKNRSLLFALPVTGKTHQIRAHLYESGYPVVGDKIYGKDENYFLKFLADGMTKDLLKELELPRQFLHSYKIKITHPFTGKKLIIKAGLPKELIDYLVMLEIN